MTQETVTALTPPPDLAMLGVMWGILADIQAALAQDTPDAAKLGAIARHLSERLPGPAGGMPSLLPGDDGDR